MPGHDVAVSGPRSRAGLTDVAIRAPRAIEWSFVATSGWRDLVWRARRWAIATAGTSLAFAITLLLAAFLASFHGEIHRSLDALGGDGYVVKAGSEGPFTTIAPLGVDRLAELRADPGLTNVAPIVTLPYTLTRVGSTTVEDVLLVGRTADGPGSWPIRHGRAPSGPGEVVLDTRTGAAIGSRVRIGSEELTVVGTTSRLHVLAGKGLAWVSIEDAQRLLFGGAPFVSGFVFDGHATTTSAIADLRVIDRAGAKRDLIRLMQPVIESLLKFRALMWAVAAAVVGSVLYLTAIERARDFAVFKATGTRDRDLVASLLLQAALLAIVASVIATGLALLLAPMFPTPVELSATLYVSAPAVAVVIGGLGSLAGVRRAMTIDPALAFGGA